MIVCLALAMTASVFATFDKNSVRSVNGDVVFGDTTIKAVVSASKSVSPISDEVYLAQGEVPAPSITSSNVVKTFSTPEKEINRYSSGQEDRSGAKSLSAYQIDSKVTESGYYVYTITQKHGGTPMTPSNIPLLIDITPPQLAELVEVVVPDGDVVIDNSYTTAEEFSLILNVEAYSHLHYYAYLGEDVPEVDHDSESSMATVFAETSEVVGDESQYTYEGFESVETEIGFFILPDGECKTVVVVVHDAVDNGEVSEFTVCKDASAPEITERVPKNDTVIGDLDSSLFFTVTDNSQLDLASIEFEVEIDAPEFSSQETYTCDSIEIECVPSDDLSSIQVNYLGDLAYGFYTVRIYAADTMGNEINYDETEYSFEIRSDVPRRLLYKLTNYQYFEDEDLYYTNVSDLDLLMDFDLDRDVQVTFMTLSAKDVDGASHNVFTDEVLDNLKKANVDNEFENKFTLHFKDVIAKSLLNTAFGSTYKSVVKAKKIMDEGGVYGPEGEFRPEFIVDTVTPEMSELSLKHIIGFGENELVFDFVEDYVWFVNVQYYDDFEGVQHNMNATLSTPGGNGRISSATYNMDVTTETERGFDLTVTICDKAMNCETSEVSVVADSSMPTVWDTYNYDNEWITSEAETFILNATDGDSEFASGIDEIRYCYVSLGEESCEPNEEGFVYVQSFTFVDDTNEVIFYRAYDKAGNPSLPESVSVNIDNSAPVSEISLLEGWYNSNSALVNITEEDSTSYVDRTLYCLVSGCDACNEDNEIFPKESNGLQFSQEGAKTFNFCSVDAAGNKQVVNTSYGLDRTAPDISVKEVKAVNVEYAVIYDEETEYYMTGDSSVKIVIEYISDGYSPLASVQVAGGVSYEPGEEENEITLISGIHAEDNEIVIVATDAAGNQAELTVLVRSDNEGPEVVFLEPNVLATEPMITLASNAEDLQPFFRIQTNEQATCVLTYVPKGLIDPMQEEFETEDSLEHTLKLSYKLKDGSNALTLNCKDVMGNSKTHNLLIILDFVPPLITSWESVDGVVIMDTTMPNIHGYVIVDNFLTQLRVTTNEPSRCRYSLTQDEFENMETEFEGIGYMQEMLTSAIELEDNTTYTYYINCQDAAGNIASFSSTYSWVAVKLVVQLDLPITIINLRPSGATNKLPPELKLSWETRRESQCKVDRNYDGEMVLIGALLDWFDFAQSVDPLKEKTNVYKYELELDGIFEENKEYTYDITCSDPSGRLDDGEAQTSFVIDTSMDPPTIIIPEYDGKEYNISEIYVYGHCEDGASIRIFMNVYDPSEANFVDLTTCENGEYDSSDLVIRGGNNTIYVEARDDAGNVGYDQRTVFYNVLGPNVSITIDPKGGTLNKLYNVTAVINELSVSTNETKRFSLFDSVFRVERMEDDVDISEQLELLESTETKRVYSTPDGQLIMQKLDDLASKITFVPNQVPYRIAGTYIVKVIPVNYAGEHGIPGQSVFLLDPFAAAVEWLTPIDKRVGKDGVPVKFSGYTEPVAQSAVLVIEEFGYSPQMDSTRTITVPLIRVFDPDDKIEKGYFELDEDVTEGLNVYKMTTMLFNHSATTPDETLYYDVKGPRVITEYVKITSGGGEDGMTPEELQELDLNPYCIYGQHNFGNCLISSANSVFFSVTNDYNNFDSENGPLDVDGNAAETYETAYDYEEEIYGDTFSYGVTLGVYESTDGLELAVKEETDAFTTNYKGHNVYLDISLMANMIWVSDNILVHFYGTADTFIWVVDKYLEKYPSTMAAKPMPDGDDNDGMAYEFEIQYGLNPYINDGFFDEDNDGLFNWYESALNSDPTNPDSDNDDLPDGFEVKYWTVLNPLDSSGDASGTGDPDFDLLNNYDELVKGTRPDRADTDGDMFSDGDDLYPLDSSKH